MCAGAQIVYHWTLMHSHAVPFSGHEAQRRRVQSQWHPTCAKKLARAHAMKGFRTESSSHVYQMLVRLTYKVLTSFRTFKRFWMRPALFWMPALPAAVPRAARLAAAPPLLATHLLVAGWPRVRVLSTGVPRGNLATSTRPHPTGRSGPGLDPQYRILLKTGFCSE